MPEFPHYRCSWAVRQLPGDLLLTEMNQAAGDVVHEKSLTWENAFVSILHDLKAILWWAKSMLGCPGKPDWTLHN